MRKIFLTLAAILCLLVTAVSQNRTIRGKITDANNNALSGATVTAVGGGSTTTDNQGNFSISVGAAIRQLQVTYVGYNPQIINVRNQNTINLSLTNLNSNLSEVVVTGISRVKKTEYTGAATSISRAAVENKPVGSFDQILQGQAPGLLALTSSGQPGNATTVIIRGQNSVAGTSNPLYILDGIPIEASVFQGLNPNDFESVDILRDASAEALYGSRGSAGVIVITTRRGSGGKMKLSYNAQFGVKDKPDFAFKPMSTPQLLQAQLDYGKIVGGTGSASIPGYYYSKLNPRYALLSPAQQASNDAILDSISKINTNWNDAVFRKGPFSNHQISLSGGAGKTRIYSSLELYNELGTTYRTDMTRGSLRNNIDYADDKLTFAVSSNIAYTKRNFQQSTTTNSTANPFLGINIAPPTSLLYKPDGTYATGNGSAFVVPNLLDLTNYDKNYSDQLKADVSFNISYKIIPSITAALTAGADFRETQASNYGSRLAFLRTAAANVTNPTTLGGFQTETLSRFLSPDIRPSITFDKVFAQKHKVTLGVVGEYLSQFTKSLSETGYGIDPRTPNTPAAITQGNAQNLLFAVDGGGKSQNALYSGLVLGSYTYDDKYTLTGSLRDDGSSKLPVQNRWQSFYSIGAVWNITKENFLKDNNTFNNLRLRASYGGAGDNDNYPAAYGDFGYYASYGASGNYSGLTTLYVTNIGNPDITWEKTYTANLGLDFSILKNRIYGSFDVYDKLTKDLFIFKQLSAEAGGYNTLINAGKLDNKGFEIDLSVDLIKNRSVTWTINAKAAYNKNNIVDLAGLASYASGTSLIIPGLPLGSHYEVKWAGVDAATGAPLYYKADGKTITTTYNAADKVQQFGTWEAPWKGGFGSNLYYKGFNISVLFSWEQGAKKEDNLEYFVENPVGFLAGGYNQSSDLNFWKNPGDIASTPSPLYGTNFSSKIIHDASFLRFRDVTISYNLPKAVTGKLKFISNLRLYVQGTNLFIWTKWRGMDPEAGPVNINLSEYPNPRAFTGGLNVTF